MQAQPLLLIGPFRQLLTMDNLPLKGALRDDSLPVLTDAGILIRDGIIQEVDNYRQLKTRHNGAAMQHVDGDYVGMPGLIDAHTHICFGGNRAKDYSMRIAGRSYQEIAASGGGIWDSVTRTREASQEDLQRGLKTRAERHLAEGVTTCEVKSGYGLNAESELKMLRTIAAIKPDVALDLVPTCLAAHIKPKDYDGTPKLYLDYVLNEILPAVKELRFSRRVDIFIEENAFGAAEAQAYLWEAKRMGFDITVHADQFTPIGSKVAVDVGAISADHLEASTDKEVEMISKSDVIPVALPGASLGLGCAFAPARKLLDKGASLVIASDWNPGSAPMGDLLLQAAVLSVYQKLNTAEVLAALTFRAAAALRLNDRGALAKGQIADVIAFPTNDYRDILYHQGKLKPSLVCKRGNVVVSEAR